MGPECGPQNPADGLRGYLTDTRRANASFLIQSGPLDRANDLQRGITTEFQPFVTASANGAPTANGYAREDVNPEVGANLRLGITSNLSLDGTLQSGFQPDRIRREPGDRERAVRPLLSGEASVLPEGIELFATPNQLVYTWQIVDPIVGGKVTSKLGPNNIAFLDRVWISRARTTTGSTSPGSGMTSGPIPQPALPRLPRTQETPTTGFWPGTFVLSSESSTTSRASSGDQ